MGITQVTGTGADAHPFPGTLGRGRQRADTPGSADKRERILAVAEQLFAAQGYASTTMEQIVQALGVTKPFVYYYFRNKLEIFELLSWRPAVACFTALDFAQGDVRPAHEKVAAGMEQLIRATIAHYPAAFFPYREPQVYTERFVAAQRRLANHFYERLCQLLEQGRAEGWFDVGEVRIAAQAACSLPGFLYQWYRPDGRLPPEAMVAELTQLACRVLGLRGSVGPAPVAQAGG
ncbi:TetR/AcrR family transcriptional regulator [Pulveribacter suum]|nr:TetR/AcrR family transcriptional regulator [Pulveribacter suum]